MKTEFWVEYLSLPEIDWIGEVGVIHWHRIEAETCSEFSRYCQALIIKYYIYVKVHSVPFCKVIMSGYTAENWLFTGKCCTHILFLFLNCIFSATVTGTNHWKSVNRVRILLDSLSLISHKKYESIFLSPSTMS